MRQRQRLVLVEIVDGAHDLGHADGDETLAAHDHLQPRGRPMRRDGRGVLLLLIDLENARVDPLVLVADNDFSRPINDEIPALVVRFGREATAGKHGNIADAVSL